MKRQKRIEDNKVKYGTVSLPITLINMIKKRIKGTGMSSVSSYVAFVLRQILASTDHPNEPLTNEEEINVRRKLKRLGYA